VCKQAAQVPVVFEPPCTWRRKDEFTTLKVVLYSIGICFSSSCLKGLDSDPPQLVFYILPTSKPRKDA
jgi:hypothetical protein